MLERTGRGTNPAKKKRFYQLIFRVILNNCSLDTSGFETICATEDEFRWFLPYGMSRQMKIQSPSRTIAKTQTEER